MSSLMRAQMGRAARRLIQTAPIRRTSTKLVASVMLEKPVQHWPRWAGVLGGVRVPRGVVPNPRPAPTGGAHPTILLEMLRRTAGLNGDVAECGVYLGQSLLLMAIALRQLGISKHIVGIDTFDGFGEEIRFDIALGGAPDVQRAVGAFSDASYDELRDRIRTMRLERSVELHKAYFADAFKVLGDRRYCFVHLDCDLYSSYKEALEFFYPRLTPGAIVLLDEYNDPPWPGCNLAVDEFLAGRPEKLRLVERSNFQKWYFEKGPDTDERELRR